MILLLPNNESFASEPAINLESVVVLFAFKCNGEKIKLKCRGCDKNRRAGFSPFHTLPTLSSWWYEVKISL